MPDAGQRHHDSNATAFASSLSLSPSALSALCSGLCRKGCAAVKMFLPRRATPGDPRGENVIKISVSWWTPVRSNMTMPGPETVLYGVGQHSAVARLHRVASCRPGLALGAFGGPL